MNFLNDVIVVLTALTLVFTSMISFKKFLVKVFMKDIKEELAHIHENHHALRREICMLVMHTEGLSLKDRIEAGEVYEKLGGNGSEAIYLKILKREYEEQLKTQN